VVERAKQPPLEELEQVLTADEVLRLQQAARSVHVDEAVLEYVVRLVQATREHRDAYLGASPRGSIALYRTSQAIALIRGREYVTPDDVKEMAPLVLAHRVILRPEAQVRGTGAEELIAEVLTQVPVPTG